MTRKRRRGCSAEVPIGARSCRIFEIGAELRRRSPETPDLQGRNWTTISTGDPAKNAANDGLNEVGAELRHGAVENAGKNGLTKSELNWEAATPTGKKTKEIIFP